MSDRSLTWYALRVAPQREFDVQGELHKREHPAIVPREYKWKRKNATAGHRVRWAYPLFARYVFAGMGILGCPIEEYARLKADIEHIQGVVSRSRLDWSPLVLPRSDLNLLMDMAGREPNMTTTDIHRALKEGGKAQIIAGPFSGKTVKIDKVTARKAKVLLEVLNSMHVVEIPIEALDTA